MQDIIAPIIGVKCRILSLELELMIIRVLRYAEGSSPSQLTQNPAVLMHSLTSFAASPANTIISVASAKVVPYQASVAIPIW